MSQKIRRGKSATKLATALCILSSGVATAGENVPKLVKTTTPIRVKPEIMRGTPFALPSSAFSGDLMAISQGQPPKLRQVSDQDFGLRGLLEPSLPTRYDEREIKDGRGAQRTNRFVELQSDYPSPKGRKFAATRSAAIPRRSQHKTGEIQTNPLVVDAPPTLRRFPVQERPLIVPMHNPDHPADAPLVAREERLSQRKVEDLDQAFDLLSIDSNDEVAIRGAARDGGFGMLAIDQIGEHLSKPADDDPASLYPPVKRFATDLVLPTNKDQSSASTFRDQLIAAAEETIVDQDVPLLPPPDESSTPDSAPAPGSTPTNSIASASDAFGQDGLLEQTPHPGAAETDSNPEVFLDQALRNHSGKVAMNVDELIAANSTQQNARPSVTTENPSKVAKKPSLAQRLIGWSKKTTTGDKPTRPKPAPTRATSDRTHSKNNTVRRKQSGGILTQWFNRTR